MACLLFVVADGALFSHISISWENKPCLTIYTLMFPIQAANRHIDIYDTFRDRSLTLFPRYTPGDTCYYAHLATAIGADGKVYACCIWKYRPEGVIADLHQETFAQVWNTGALDTFFQKFDIAEKCTRCFLKDKNDFIQSLVEAEHIHFV